MRKIIFSIMGLIIWGYASVLAQNSTCPANHEGFLAPRLQVGQRGIVVPGGTGNRVRANPDASAEQVGTLPPGAEFEIIGGPECDSSASIIWWQVAADDDLEGWTAEGLPPDDYFLEPIIVSEPTQTPSPFPTLAPTPTPTPALLPALGLPDLAVLSPDNVETINIMGEIPAIGPASSLFFSPDVAHLFIVNVTREGRRFANVYSFPDLRSIAQGLTLTGTSGADRYGELFTADSRYMVAVRFNNEDIVFYKPGEQSFMLERESFRYVHVADLNDSGILAVGFSDRSQDGGPLLCFIDKFGDTYVPDDRLCLPQETGIDALAFLSDGLRLLSGSENGLVLYDVHSGEAIQTFNYAMVRGGTMAVLPSAEHTLPTVFISKDGFVLSANLETGEERTYPSGAGQTARKITFNEDGTQMMLIVPTTNVPDVFVVDVVTKALLHQNALYGGENAAYSPNGKLAFINNEIYETRTWQLLNKLSGHQHIITFSPDGTMLLVKNTTSDTFEIYGVPNS